MAWASTTPTAIAALVRVFGLALPGTTVLDGPTPADAALTEALTVGYTDELTSNAVEGDLAIEGLGIASDREQYTVQCAAFASDGGADIAAARTRVYEMLAAARQALVDDSRLGGAVGLARIAQVTLTQAQGSQGAMATLAFGVVVDGYTGR